MWRLFCLPCAFLFWSMTTLAYAMTIHIPAPEGEQDSRYPYFVQLLRLALDHTALKGNYQLVTYPREVPQSRAFALINAGELDLLWSMTDIEREKHFLPIRIPLMQGLLGYRVLLINRQDEQTFAQMSVAQLKQMPCYQGGDWPDTPILAANGFKVRGIADYKRIHTMLDKGTIRCFPRGLLEAWGEIRMKGLKHVMVDRHFLLIYPTDVYYFVHQEAKSFAKTLEQGLRAAIADGSFAHLLFNYPPHKEALDQAGLSEREIIHLSNPLLPAQTPLDDQQLWFSPQRAPVHAH